jgi:spore maturation protein CgeB
MSYRICCITHIAYDQVSDAMRHQAQAHSSNFAALDRHYSEQGFIYADSLAHAMRDIGNESSQILYNLEVLQKLWAAENDVSYREETWPQEIALAQIKAYRPDVVMIQGLHRDPTFTLVPTQMFRDECPFVKLVVATSGFAMEPEVARFVDIVVANAPVLCEHYRDAGVSTELVYHAFDDRVPDQLAAYQRIKSNTDELYDFTFSGSTGYGWREGHKSRYYDLVYLVVATGVKLWGYERIQDQSLSSPLALARASASLRPLMWRLSAREFVALIQRLTETLFGSDLPSIPLTTIFPERCQGALFGMPMYDVIARSRLSFNRHSDADSDVGNIRMFHATGLGSCLINDAGPNLRDLFEPDSEIVVYRSIEECVEKVRYLLDHDEERKAIAEAGRRRTLRDHTYARRCEQLDALIAQALKMRAAMPNVRVTSG